jgi:hypothetical protein
LTDSFSALHRGGSLASHANICTKGALTARTVNAALVFRSTFLRCANEVHGCRAGYNFTADGAYLDAAVFDHFNAVNYGYFFESHFDTPIKINFQLSELVRLKVARTTKAKQVQQLFEPPGV